MVAPKGYVPPKGHRKKVNENIASMITEISGGDFLEIGIGPKVRLDRIEVMNQSNIQYVGVDFETVCNMHMETIDDAGVNRNHMKFMSNSVGTYLYNLIRLKRENKKFDLIYLDGHHTLYVDFAAAFACLPLLKDGGRIAFDDVNWTLANKEESLKKSEFYSDIYDFSLYTKEEREEAHIAIITEEYLVAEYGLKKVEEYCEPYWTVLQK